MRILVLSDLYPPYYMGGHEIQCKVIADGLSKRGHEVYVLTSKYGLDVQNIDNNIYRSLYYLGDKDVKENNRRSVQIKIALLGRLNYLITKKVIKHLKPDIIYSGQISDISIFPMKVIQSYNIPILHHLGNYFFVELVEMCILGKNLLKRFYRKRIHGFKNIDDFDFNHILVVSKAVKKTYVEAGFSADNISIIPRGIPSGLIKNEYNRNVILDGKKTKLLYVGRLSREKGIETALKSVHHLIYKLGVRNLTLHIIGEGNEKYEEDIAFLSDSLNLKDYVKFRGKLLYEEVLKEYSNYDMLLVPSTLEAFPSIIIEAMSQGLPVIASKVGGIPEIVENEETGLLVPPGDPKKLAQAVKKLVDNPSLYEKIIRNGIKLVKKEYTNEKIIEKIENYLSNGFQQSKKKLTK
jgi:glycogen synthase